MFRLALVFLAITLISGALVFFGLPMSGISWVVFVFFLVLTVVILSILFDGLGSRHPMD